MAPSLGKKQELAMKNPLKKIPFPIALIIPIEIVMMFLLIFPLVVEIWVSLTNWTPLLGTNWWHAKFIGLKNYYQILFKDNRFVMAVLRTTLIATVCVVVELGLGLLYGLLFVRDFRGKKIFVSLLLLPMMIIPLVAGYNFFMLFIENGPVNQILGWILGREVTLHWISDPTLGLITIMVADIWEWTPLMFLILMAGLTSVPQNQVRAAVSLGAGSFQIFRFLTIPLMKPIILIAVVIRGMELFKIFDLVFILTRGGPGTTTETISFYLYSAGFSYMRMGYIAAGAFIVRAIFLTASYYILKPVVKEIA
jgi:multiple sugar transport system permease protein